jgi:hypothetical protein
VEGGRGVEAGGGELFLLGCCGKFVLSWPLDGGWGEVRLRILGFGGIYVLELPHYLHRFRSRGLA